MATASNTCSTQSLLVAFSGGTTVPSDITGATYKFTFSGTWAAGDRIAVVLNYSNVDYTVGYKEVTGLQPSFVTTYQNQIMFCASDKLVCSGIDEPTGFEERFAGFGYIQMSGERGEALECVAVAPYAGRLALFADNNVQLWQYNADPKLWALVQSLENIGTCAPRSVVSYGELDVFFLSYTGVRSLRARESTDLVNVHDVGTSIDRLIQPIVEAATALQLEQCFGWYNINDGRYWLYLVGKFYVFSYFPATKVSAWSVYDPFAAPSDSGAVSFVPEYSASQAGTLYLLGNADAYRALVTAGRHGTIYDKSTIIVPFYDMKTPGTLKYFVALDLLGFGTWKVEVSNGVNVLVADISAAAGYGTLTASVVLSTVEYARIPVGLHGTHLLVKLTQLSEGHAALSSMIIHWEPETHR